MGNQNYTFMPVNSFGQGMVFLLVILDLNIWFVTFFLLPKMVWFIPFPVLKQIEGKLLAMEPQDGISKEEGFADEKQTNSQHYKRQQLLHYHQSFVGN